MENIKIRNRAKELRVPFWQLADKLGICENTVGRKLRYPLSEEEEKRYLNAIDEIAREEAKRYV